MTDVCVTANPVTSGFIRCSEDGEFPFMREFCRSPFQWDASPNAGFSDGPETWLLLSENYQRVNLAAQLETNGSHVDIYKKLMAIRKTEAGANGTLVIQALSDKILVIRRELDDKAKKSLFSIFNFGATYTNLNFINEAEHPSDVNIQISRSNSFYRADSKVEFNSIKLAPYYLIVGTYNSAVTLKLNFILLFVTLIMKF